MAQWNQVVVGVDGSEDSRRALQWASEEASMHGAELLAVKFVDAASAGAYSAAFRSYMGDRPHPARRKHQGDAG
jgi:nucleotide-binding universal stress UspA family protein